MTDKSKHKMAEINFGIALSAMNVIASWRADSTFLLLYFSSAPLAFGRAAEQDAGIKGSVGSQE
jgi:hypothetical protein